MSRNERAEYRTKLFVTKGRDITQAAAKAISGIPSANYTPSTEAMALGEKVGVCTVTPSDDPIVDDSIVDDSMNAEPSDADLQLLTTEGW